MKQITMNQQAVLVFTDLVDSVKLQQHVGAVLYGRLKARHDQLFLAAIKACPNAKILETTGDGFYARFPSCSSAVEACLCFQHKLAVEQIEGYRLRARVGIHSGEVVEDSSVTNPLLGMAPSITARVMSLALPGQILVTATVYRDAAQYLRELSFEKDISNPTAVRWLNHGEFQFKGSLLPEKIFEAGVLGTAPLRCPPGGEKARPIRSQETTEQKLSEPHAQRPEGTRRFATSAIALFCIALIATTYAARFYWTEDRSASDEPVSRVVHRPVPEVAELLGELQPTEQLKEMDTGDSLALLESAQEEPTAVQPKEEPPAKAVIEVSVVDQDKTVVSEKGGAISNTPQSIDKLIPPTPPKEFTIEFTRLICLKTNNFHGTDYIDISIHVDDQPVELEYPSNHEGTPCAYLRENEEWNIGKRVTFRDRVTASVSELQGLSFRIGRVTIQKKTIDHKIFHTTLERPFASHRYILEWRLIAPQ